MRDSAEVGIAQAQGGALHNQRARRCTSYVIPTKQMIGGAEMTIILSDNNFWILTAP